MAATSAISRPFTVPSKFTSPGSAGGRVAGDLGSATVTHRGERGRENVRIGIDDQQLTLLSRQQLPRRADERVIDNTTTCDAAIDKLGRYVAGTGHVVHVSRYARKAIDVQRFDGALSPYRPATDT